MRYLNMYMHVHHMRLLCFDDIKDVQHILTYYSSLKFLFLFFKI